MARKVTRPRKTRPARIDSKRETNHIGWCLIGVLTGLAWTFAGCGVAAIEGSLREFLQEWVRLQGFVLIAVGTWLLLMIRSSSFTARVSRLVTDGAERLGVMGKRAFHFGIVGAVTVVGTATVSSMGFNGQGAVLVFMWVTCGLICLASGVVTSHTLRVLGAVHHLRPERTKLSRFAPARTPELRAVVSYFSSYTVLVTIGYVFAVLTTVLGRWTGDKEYIDAVRLFWPLIYVPTCTVALIYPHVVVHRLIQNEKERTLLSCQRDIDDLLSKYANLKKEEIERTNELAQLFERIAATPNYVIDFGIAARTILPLVFNVITLFAKFASRQG